MLTCAFCCNKGSLLKKVWPLGYCSRNHSMLYNVLHNMLTAQNINQWECVDITVAYDTARLVFEGSARTASPYGDMAVDDLRVTSGRCNTPNPVPALTPQPQPTSVQHTQSWNLNTGWEDCEVSGMLLNTAAMILREVCTHVCGLQHPMPICERHFLRNLLNICQHISERENRCHKTGVTFHKLE